MKKAVLLMCFILIMTIAAIGCASPEAAHIEKPEQDTQEQTPDTESAEGAQGGIVGAENADDTQQPIYDAQNADDNSAATGEVFFRNPGFLFPLEILDFDGILDIWGTFTIANLSFQTSPGYTVMADTDSLAHLFFPGPGKHIIVTALPSIPGFTMDDALQNILDGEHNLEERGEVYINDVLWSYATISYNFGGTDIYHTVLLTNKDGIMYQLSLSMRAMFMQHQNIHRQLLISSMRFAEGGAALPGSQVIEFAHRFFTLKTGQEPDIRFFDHLMVVPGFGTALSMRLEHEGDFFFLIEAETGLIDEDGTREPVKISDIMVR